MLADTKQFCEGARGATLFHCAGLVHPRRVADFYEVNVRGTEKLLEAATDGGRAARGDRLVEFTDRNESRRPTTRSTRALPSIRT